MVLFTVVNKIWIVILSIINNLNIEDSLLAIAPFKARWDISEFNPFLVKAGVDAAIFAGEESS